MPQRSARLSKPRHLEVKQKVSAPEIILIPHCLQNYGMSKMNQEVGLQSVIGGYKGQFWFPLLNKFGNLRV